MLLKGVISLGQQQASLERCSKLTHEEPSIYYWCQRQLSFNYSLESYSISNDLQPNDQVFHYVISNASPPSQIYMNFYVLFNSCIVEEFQKMSFGCIIKSNQSKVKLVLQGLRKMRVHSQAKYGAMFLVHKGTSPLPSTALIWSFE